MMDDDEFQQHLIDEALLFLVSHRLQQIVSMLHDEQLALIVPSVIYLFYSLFQSCMRIGTQPSGANNYDTIQCLMPFV